MTHTPSCIYMLRTATEATLGARCHTYLFAPPVRKCTDDKYDSCSTVLLLISSTCIVVYVGHMREDMVATITCTCERNATGNKTVIMCCACLVSVAERYDSQHAMNLSSAGRVRS